MKEEIVNKLSSKIITTTRNIYKQNIKIIIVFTYKILKRLSLLRNLHNFRHVENQFTP